MAGLRAVIRGPDDVVTVATTTADPAYRNLLWRCEGCGEVHACQVAGKPQRAVWTWNGSTTKPTLSPSVLKVPQHDTGGRRCHSFVREGVVEFLADCDHHLAGKKVPMKPELADIFAEEFGA